MVKFFFCHKNYNTYSFMGFNTSNVSYIFEQKVIQILFLFMAVIILFELSEMIAIEAFGNQLLDTCKCMSTSKIKFAAIS